HLMILTAFGYVKLSNTTEIYSDMYIPTAKINPLKNQMEKTSVIPKPKVTRPSLNKQTKDRKEVKKNSFFHMPDSPTYRTPSAATKTADATEYSMAKNSFALGGVEFFGSGTYERKICFVVDCSGSMQGTMGQVKQQLKSSIGKLVPDQYFYVIFFGDGRLFESGNGKLVRASQNNKENAYDFIDGITAAGRTNAFQALERAVKVEDDQGTKASVFYFLTDGFELASGESESLSLKIAELIIHSAPNTQINTISFWPTETDSSILRSISSLSGGECIIIEDSDF
ncbi:MAG: VWA domain-containing protein, partial [Planctomycetota bacterium]